jgi:hypothetical protein
MASHNQGDGSDPTRGSGDDKVTQEVTPDLEAPPGAQTSSTHPGEADPAGGGCLKYGWGCLPVVAALVLIPTGLLF